MVFKMLRFLGGLVEVGFALMFAYELGAGSREEEAEK